MRIGRGSLQRMIGSAMRAGTGTSSGGSGVSGLPARPRIGRACVAISILPVGSSAITGNARSLVHGRF